jgi:hypothetical protein
MYDMHVDKKTYGMAGGGGASGAEAEGTVSSRGADRRYGSRDLGDTKVLDRGKGCMNINGEDIYILVRRGLLVFARQNH